MDRAQFATPGAWWLTEIPLRDYQAEEVRLKLGAQRGWDAQWSSDPTHLDEVYTLIEGASRELLQELDQVTEDYQLRWLEQAFEAIFGSAGGSGASGEKQPDTQTEAPAVAQLAADGPPAQWDASWQMLYRVLPSGEYQFAFSDDQATVRSGTDWMSREAAAAAQAASAAAAAEELPEVSAAAQEVLSEAGTNVSGIADGLGIPAERVAELVNDPEFEEMVAKEVERLRAERAG